MASPRQIVVDDTNPSIQYTSGTWSVADPTKLKGGNFGRIFNSTSHAASSDAALSFSFNGSSVFVYGTTNVVTTNGVTDPTWSCFVDGQPIDNPQPDFKFYQNNWLLCQQPQLEPGLHELTVQVVSNGQPFYLDDIVYTPTEDVVPESSSVLLYPLLNPAVSFSGDWVSIAGDSQTQSRGAQVALDFDGTTVIAWGVIPDDTPHNVTWATYTIDGGTPVNVTLAPFTGPNSDVSFYNIPLFTTPTLPQAKHKLVVEYGGDSEHLPLMIRDFRVLTGSSVLYGLFIPSATALESPATSSVPSTTSTPSASTSTSTSRTSSQRPAGGVIAGGVMGGLALLALLTTIVVFYTRRRRRQARARAAIPFDLPLPAMRPHPFPAPGTKGPGGSSTRTSESEDVGPVQRRASIPSSTAERDMVVVQHADSGVRGVREAAPAPGERRVVELPPGYTAE